jgi:hypothetical protein
MENHSYGDTDQRRRFVEVQAMRECFLDAQKVLPKGYGDDNARVLLAIAFFLRRSKSEGVR